MQWPFFSFSLGSEQKFGKYPQAKYPSNYSRQAVGRLLHKALVYHLPPDQLADLNGLELTQILFNFGCSCPRGCICKYEWGLTNIIESLHISALKLNMGSVHETKQQSIRIVPVTASGYVHVQTNWYSKWMTLLS